MSERRRLPVVNRPPAPSGGDGDDDEARPPWHWIGFGVVAIFAAWLPLAAGAAVLGRRAFEATFAPGATEEDVARALAAMTASERVRFTATQALPQILALALAAFAGGFLVGRFGRGTGAREAASSGGATALVATALAARSLELGWAAALTVVLTAGVAIGFAAWGGRAGAKKKSP